MLYLFRIMLMFVNEFYIFNFVTCEIVLLSCFVSYATIVVNYTNLFCVFIYIFKISGFIQQLVATSV